MYPPSPLSPSLSLVFHLATVHCCDIILGLQALKAQKALLAKAAAGGGSSGGANALGRLVAAARTALGREHQAAAREHSAMRDALDEGRVAATRVGALCAVAGVIGGAMAARLWRQKPVAPQKQYV